MIYRDFKGEKISSYGMGCMRLPVINGENSCIDEAAAAEMVDYAMEAGVNYFDTAWGYHGGNSETVMGRILSAYPRNSYFIATKFPGYDVGNFGKVEEIFEKQLEKLGTDYIDFYLLHNLCESNIDLYLDDDKYRTVSYLMEQKAKGRIKHLGFSSHGSDETNRRLVERYKEELEFCQLQLNWIDCELDNAAVKTATMAEYGIPVWDMEPLRGGSLCKLRQDVVDDLKCVNPELNAVQWAFNYLKGLDNVSLVISGASTLEQIKENISCFENDDKLNYEEQTALKKASESIRSELIPCTGCGYCLEKCPKKLNIPWLLEIYNDRHYSGSAERGAARISKMAPEKRPFECIGCGECEKVCTQKVSISKEIKEFVDSLRSIKTDW